MLANGLNDFQNLLESYPKYSKFEHNPIALNIFALLSKLESIQNMIYASEADKPALSACISQIENLYGTQKIFNLTDDFTKQSVGAMVKIVLEPLGYEPYKQKKFQKGLSVFVKSASVYHLSRSPRLKLVQKLSVEPASSEIGLGSTMAVDPERLITNP